jgi:hypothetical protein
LPTAKAGEHVPNQLENLPATVAAESLLGDDAFATPSVQGIEIHARQLDAFSVLKHERAHRLTLEARVRALVAELSGCQSELHAVSEQYSELCRTAEEDARRAQSELSGCQSKLRAVSEKYSELCRTAEEDARRAQAELGASQNKLHTVSEKYSELSRTAEEDVKRAQAAAAAAQCDRQEAVSQANVLRAAEANMAAKVESLTSQLLSMTAKRNAVLVNETQAVRKHVERAEQQVEIIRTLEAQIADLAARLQELDDRTDSLTPLCPTRRPLVPPRVAESGITADDLSTSTDIVLRRVSMTSGGDQAEIEVHLPQPRALSATAMVAGCTPDVGKATPRNDATLVFSSSTEPWSLGSSQATFTDLNYATVENRSSYANVRAEPACRGEIEKNSSAQIVASAKDVPGAAAQAPNALKLAEQQFENSPSSSMERHAMSVGPSTPRLQSPLMGVKSAFEHLDESGTQVREETLAVQNLESESSGSLDKSSNASPSSLPIDEDMLCTSNKFANPISYDWAAGLEQDLERFGGLPCRPGTTYISLGRLSINNFLNNLNAGGQ